MERFPELKYEALQVGETFVSDTKLVTPEDVEAYAFAVDDHRGRGGDAGGSDTGTGGQLLPGAGPGLVFLDARHGPASPADAVGNAVAW